MAPKTASIAPHRMIHCHHVRVSKNEIIFFISETEITGPSDTPISLAMRSAFWRASAIALSSGNQAGRSIGFHHAICFMQLQHEHQTGVGLIQTTDDRLGGRCQPFALILRLHHGKQSAMVYFGTSEDVG